MFYLTCKWLHVISFISWLGGLLYLFRLLVYQAEYGLKNADQHALLALMSQRLYQMIVVPAMILTWVGGLGMLSINHAIAKAPWMAAKLLCIIALVGLTHWCNRLRKNFAAKKLEVTLSGKTLRWVNEIPTLLMLVIVALATFRP